MQLEQREADIAQIPIEPFMAALGDPSDQALQTFYRANLARYTVPEQRVLDLARIDPSAVANVAATDKEIVDYYRANQATYGASSRRVLSQVVLPSQQAADALAAKLRGGQSFAEAAKPLGFAAADIAIGAQSREQYQSLTSKAVADAVFAPSVKAGAVVGPLRSPLGWTVASRSMA